MKDESKRGGSSAVSTAQPGAPRNASTAPNVAMRGTRHSSPNQVTGPQDEATEFDFAAIYTDKVGPLEDRDYTEWRAMFQNAAGDFLITPWDPHPSACPSTPCPPCEE